MKIFLLDPGVYSYNEKNRLCRRILPSLGLATIAAVLKKNDHEIIFEDQNASNIRDDRLIKKICFVRPDIVGISCLSSTHDKVINLCKSIKEQCPHTLIVLGNTHSSYFAEYFLKTENVDFVVHGEGEYSLSEIARAVEGRDPEMFKEIKGISFVHNGQIIRTPRRDAIENLDMLPFPAWEFFNLNYYRTNIFSFASERMLPIQASRGCRFHCDFCVQDKLSIGIRLKSAKRIIEEIKHNYERFNIKFFGFADAYFPTTEEAGFEFCDLFEKSELHKELKWGTSCCVDLISENLLKRMKEVSLWFVYYGFESGDEKHLNNLGKCNLKIRNQLHERLGWENRCSVLFSRHDEKINDYDHNGFGKSISKDKCLRVMDISKNLGIRTVGLFLFGFPRETRESINKTIDFALKLNPDLARFGLIIPYPGTKLYEEFMGGVDFDKQFKSFMGQQFWYGWKKSGKIFNCTELSDKELYNMQYKAIVRFYCRPSKILNFLIKGNILNVSLSSVRYFLLSKIKNVKLK